MAGLPKFALLFCGTQYGWATQLPHLFPGASTPPGGPGPADQPVLRVPSLHVFGATDPFLETVREAACAALAASAADLHACLVRATCWQGCGRRKRRTALRYGDASRIRRGIGRCRLGATRSLSSQLRASFC